jgi:hypothetical protein
VKKWRLHPLSPEGTVVAKQNNERNGDFPFAVDLRVIEAAVSRVDGSYAAFF